jgi:hypothetical protein
MMGRDEKELVHDHIFRLRVPFTIIDVGYWHSISFPSLPSGRGDYAMWIPKTEINGDGNMPTLLTEKRDIGRYVARIIRDPRTLNKRVVTWSDEISQNDIWSLMERLSGETIPRVYVDDAETLKRRDEARAAYAEALKTGDPQGWAKRLGVISAEYNYAKFVRGDNTLENAKYLGYLDAKELYPDFKPMGLEEYLLRVLEGKERRIEGDVGAVFAKRFSGENAHRKEDATN